MVVVLHVIAPNIHRARTDTLDTLCGTWGITRRTSTREKSCEERGRRRENERGERCRRKESGGGEGRTGGEKREQGARNVCLFNVLATSKVISG